MSYLKKLLESNNELLSYYEKINLMVNNSHNLKPDICKACCLYFIKKHIEDNNDDIDNLSEQFTIYNIITELNITLSDFIDALREITLRNLNEYKIDVDYLSNYYNLMKNNFNNLRKICDKFFFVLYEKSEFYLKFFWLLFSHLKKKILKRKNDFYECSYLLCSILDELKSDLTVVSNQEYGEFDKYMKLINFSDRGNIVNHICFKNKVRIFINETLCVNNINYIHPDMIEISYDNLIQKYRDILIPEEIDDRLFYNFYNKSKSNYESFIDDIDAFLDKDIYNIIKAEEKISYKEIYYEFEKDYLIKYNIHNKFGYSNKHKGIYLKLLEKTSKSNNLTNYKNFLFISYYVYLYLLYVEEMKNFENIIISFCSYLNKYQYFDITETLLILIYLNSSNIPNQIKTIIKSLKAIIFTKTIWENDSKLFEILLHNKINTEHKTIIKKVYIYAASNIQNITNYLKVQKESVENIWLLLKYILSNEHGILRNNNLDAIIISSIYYVINNNVDISISDIIHNYLKSNKLHNDILLKYLIENENIHQINCQMKNEKGYINTILEKVNKIQYKKIKLSRPTYLNFYIEDDFYNFLPFVQNEYNTILVLSPFKPEIEFLGNKRIRQITPPIPEKISISPFNTKRVFTLNDTNSSFKDLNKTFKKII